MAEPTVKSIKINIDAIVDKGKLQEEAKKVQEAFNKIGLSGDIKQSFTKSETAKRVLEALTAKRQELMSQLPFAKGEERKIIQKELNEIEKGIQENELYRLQKLDELKENIKSTLGDIGTWMKRKVTQFFTDVIKEIPKALNEISEYNVSGSIFGTSKGRETMLQWGLSEGQAYAFNKTKDILGISTDEDLWYMNANQREKFAELIGRYTGKYDELAQKDLLKSYEEFKLEFMLLKEDLTYDLIQIIVDNKDTIKWFLETGVQVFKGLMNFLGNFIGTKSYTTSDLMTTYNSSNVSNSKSYNLSNVFNISGSSKEQAQQYSAALTNIMNQLKGS